MRTGSAGAVERAAVPTGERGAVAEGQRGKAIAVASKPPDVFELPTPLAPPAAPPPLTGQPLTPPIQAMTFTRGDHTWTDPFAGFESEREGLPTVWVAAKNREAQDSLDASAMFRRIKEELAAPIPGSPPPTPPPARDTSVLDLNNPDTWSVDGSTNAIDFGKSPDGKWSTQLVGRNGGDDTALVISPTGAAPTEYIDQFRGSPVWMPDSSGFYYGVEPWSSDVPDEDWPGIRELRFHRMGTPVEQDAVIHAGTKDSTRTIDAWKVGPYLALRIWNGPGDNDLYLRDLAAADAPAPFIPLAARANEDTNTISWANGRLFMLTSEGADRRRLVEVDPKRPEPAHWKTVIPENPSATLNTWMVANDRVVAFYSKEGSQFIEVSRVDGKPMPNGRRAVTVTGLPDLPYVYTSRTVEDGKLRFAASSLTQPAQKYVLDLQADSGVAQLDGPAKSDPRMKDLVTKRVFVTSKDGTKVPMYVVHHKDVPLDGNNPTILEAYGGFLTSITLHSRPHLLPFFRRGGVYALSGVRGGSEYGESWHEAGRRENKQRGVEDFLASAQALISAGYTRPQKLGINGTSNGGLLMGAAMTQRPDLFKAVVMGSPLTDMLRYDTADKGKTWVPEYGDPDKPEELAWLLAYSPYQNVDPMKRYPAVMITSGAGDDRVSPWHAQKMSARLHGLTNGPNLLRTGARAGHFFNDDAEELAFLCEQLGAPLEPPKRFSLVSIPS